MRTVVAAFLLMGCAKIGAPPAVVDMAAQVAPPDLSKASPATPLTTLDGKAVDLAAYRKQATLIAMWATFCAPCMQELPMLDALHKKTKDDPDVAIIAISEDDIASDADRKHVADVAAKLGLTLTVLVDADHAIQQRFGNADGASPVDGGDASLTLPTLIYLRQDGHYTRKNGFNPNVAQDAFVSDEIAKLALIKAGTLPDEHYVVPGTNVGKVASKKVLPAMATPDFSAKWPAMRKELEAQGVDKGELDAAEATLKRGEPTTVGLPTKPAPKPTPAR